MIHRIPFTTNQSSQLVDVTSQVREIVQKSGVKEGVCIVYSPHTTAGVTLNTTHDPSTALDILDGFDHIVPTRATFKHTLDTPADAAGHIKLVLVGNSVHLPIQNGDLLIGHSQSILFFEFDGPRDREVQVQILKEA